MLLPQIDSSQYFWTRQFAQHLTVSPALTLCKRKCSWCTTQADSARHKFSAPSGWVSQLPCEAELSPSYRVGTQVSGGRSLKSDKLGADPWPFFSIPSPHTDFIVVVKSTDSLPNGKPWICHFGIPWDKSFYLAEPTAICLHGDDRS